MGDVVELEGKDAGLICRCHTAYVILGIRVVRYYGFVLIGAHQLDNVDGYDEGTHGRHFGLSHLPLSSSNVLVVNHVSCNCPNLLKNAGLIRVDLISTVVNLVFILHAILHATGAPALQPEDANA